MAQKTNATNISSPLSYSTTYVGIFCMIFCILNWVFLSLFLQSVEAQYYKPYFIRFCVNSSYSFVVIPWYIMKKVYEYKHKSSAYGKDELLINIAQHDDNQDTNDLSSVMCLTELKPVQNSAKVPLLENTLTDKQLFVKLLLPMIVISFLALMSGYAYYWCLKYVNAAIANTVYQSECAYVYILSICLVKHVRITIQKIIAIVVSLSGVAMISFYGNTSDADGTITGKTDAEKVLGLALLFFSTISFSAVEVLIDVIGNKWFRKDRQIQDTLLLQSVMGMETMCIWWIFFFVWQYTNLEIFVWPNYQQIISILLTSALDLSYNGAYFVGITLLNAFLMAMSSLLVIPVSIIALVIIYSHNPTTMGVVGAIMIFIGFILLELPLKKICCGQCGADSGYIEKEKETTINVDGTCSFGDL